MLNDCWTVLGIAPTKEQRDIKRAYASKLKSCRPEDDADGFQRLVGARDAAISFARSQNSSTHDVLPTNFVRPLADETSQPEKRAKSDMAARHDILALVQSNLDDGQLHEHDNPPSETIIDQRFSSPPLVEDTGPGMTVDEVSRDSLVRIYADLDEVFSFIEESGVYDAPAWKPDRWSALFNLASDLSFEQRRQFYGHIINRLVHALPKTSLLTDQELNFFSQGYGCAAVVECIENECQFQWVEFGPKTPSTGLYMFWLAAAQSARDLIERRSKGHRGYRNETTGLPVFPTNDARLLLAGKYAFYEKSQRKAKWAVNFDLVAFLIPSLRFLTARIYGWGFTLMLLSIISMIVALEAVLADPLYQLSAIAFVLLVRLLASFAFAPQFVKVRIRYVIKADNEGMLTSKSRIGLFEKLSQPPFGATIYTLIDMAVLVCTLLFCVIMFTN